MIHFGPLLRNLHCCFSQTVTAELAAMELTSAQGHIMGYLSHCKEPPCPRDVEEAFQLSHPTVSGLLARLEKKEFIALRPDPKDRRCKRIYVLPRGLECDGNIRKHMMENEAKIVQGFSDEEKAQFADFLARATRNMGGEPHFHETKEDTDQ